MSDCFSCTVVGLESVAPGMVFGTVNVVCRACGKTSVHEFNEDGTNAHLCLMCGVRNEI